MIKNHAKHDLDKQQLGAVGGTSFSLPTIALFLAKRRGNGYLFIFHGSISSYSFLVG